MGGPIFPECYFSLSALSDYIFPIVSDSEVFRECTLVVEKAALRGDCAHSDEHIATGV